MKKCSKCKIEKEYSNFNKNKYNKDGYQYHCKDCRVESRIKNKDKKRIYDSEYSLKNKNKIKERCKNWKQNNKDKINKYNRERASSDLNYKILHNLRNRVGNAIKFNYKSTSTKELLGCSIEYLRLYLEDMFDDDMSWYNYGLWHIDHIRPCASFNLSDLDQQKQCFHYTNLQPLWAKDNLSKGAKYES